MGPLIDQKLEDIDRYVASAWSREPSRPWRLLIHCWPCAGSTRSCPSSTWRWWRLSLCMPNWWMKIQSTPCTPSCRASSTTCSNLAVRLNRYRRPSHFIQYSAKHLRFGFYAFRKSEKKQLSVWYFAPFFFFWTSANQLLTVRRCTRVSPRQGRIPWAALLCRVMSPWSSFRLHPLSLVSQPLGETNTLV